MTKLGRIYNRDHFLNNIAKSLHRDRRTKDVILPKWSTEPQWNVLGEKRKDELVDVLEKQCQRIHTHFIKSSTKNLCEDLFDVIKKFNSELIIRWDDDRFDKFGLETFFEGIEQQLGTKTFIWDHTKPEYSINVAAQADIGITFSDITLAESGTLVLFSDKGKGRSVSLLPKIHLAIVPKSTIVPRLSQATQKIHEKVRNGEVISSCINFISGPSNSADIEMNLVVGVHGPLEAIYILIEDR